MRVYYLVVHMSRNEWSTDDAGHKMENLAREYVEQYKALVNAETGLHITVYEHGGWWLIYNEDLVVIGTANDQAQLSWQARQWGDRFRSAKTEWLPSVRREPQ